MNSLILRVRLAILPTLLVLLCMTSCTIRETGQEKGPSREPIFRLRAVEEATLNGLDVLPLREPADMDLPKRNHIIEGYVNKQLALNMRVQLTAYNPGLETSSITGLDYTVLIDGRSLGTGRMVTALEVPARDSVQVPLTFEFNTYKYLGNDAMPALRNFALGFGDLRRQRVVLRVRPILRAPKGRTSRASNSRAAVAMSLHYAGKRG
jgi:hypothetical protein